MAQQCLGTVTAQKKQSTVITRTVVKMSTNMSAGAYAQQNLKRGSQSSNPNHYQNHMGCQPVSSAALVVATVVDSVVSSALDSVVAGGGGVFCAGAFHQWAVLGWDLALSALV